MSLQDLINQEFESQKKTVTEGSELDNLISSRENQLKQNLVERSDKVEKKKGLLERITGIATGVAKGIGTTITDVAEIGARGMAPIINPNLVLADIITKGIKGEKIDWKAELKKAYGSTKVEPVEKVAEAVRPALIPKTSEEKIGYYGEQIAEFAVPVAGLGKAVSKIVPKIEAKAPKIERLVGKIIQGDIKDIKPAVEALSKIETKGIKTFKELSDVIGSKTKIILDAVGEKFAGVKGNFKPKQLETITKVGTTKVKQNFVSKALNQLDELYGKIEDIPSKIKIQNLIKKANKEGLTAQEINNIAKEYGSEFGSKAFSKVTKEPLTSVNAQAYENIRTGVKETARRLISDNSTRELDKTASKMIKTRELIDDMAEKVNTLEQKIIGSGIVSKAGKATGKIIDVATGGFVKGFMKQFIGNIEKTSLNAIELQGQLQKNLKILDGLLGKSDSWLIKNQDKIIPMLKELGKREAVLGITKINK